MPVYVVLQVLAELAQAHRAALRSAGTIDSQAHASESGEAEENLREGKEGGCWEGGGVQSACEIWPIHTVPRVERGRVDLEEWAGVGGGVGYTGGANGGLQVSMLGGVCV